MHLAFEIAIGIWLGGLFLIGTCWAWFALKERIERNARIRAPWYRGLVPRGRF